MSNSFQQLVARAASRLRYPHLFVVLLLLFLVDLIIPDAIPFVDEALLALLTVLVGSWKSRRPPSEGDHTTGHDATGAPPVERLPDSNALPDSSHGESGPEDR